MSLFHFKHELYIPIYNKLYREYHLYYQFKREWTLWLSSLFHFKCGSYIRYKINHSTIRFHNYLYDYCPFFVANVDRDYHHSSLQGWVSMDSTYCLKIHNLHLVKTSLENPKYNPCHCHTLQKNQSSDLPVSLLLVFLFSLSATFIVLHLPPSHPTPRHPLYNSISPLVLCFGPGTCPPTSLIYLPKHEKIFSEKNPKLTHAISKPSLQEFMIFSSKVIQTPIHFCKFMIYLSHTIVLFI